MSKLFIEDTSLTAIGDAIREKTGKEDLIKVGDMPAEIASITTGGGGNDTLAELLMGTLTDYTNDDVSKITQYSFYLNKVIKNISCKNATIIEQRAFNESKIVNVDMPKVEKIETYAFNGCVDLKHFDFSSIVANDGIGIRAFFNTGLEEISLPNVEKFAPQLFSGVQFGGNKKLHTVNAPKLQQLTNDCFGGCTALKTFNAPNLKEVYNNGLANTAFEEVEFPALTRLYQTSFKGCSQLKKVKAPLSSINASVFENDELFDTLIITNYSNVATLSNVNAFTNTPIANGTGYIYVPAALIEDYKVATNWVTYANQFRAIEDYPDICGGVE